MKKQTKTKKSQLEAVARYSAKAERWAVIASGERGELLKKAKASGTLPADFWAFLEEKYS